MMEKKDKQQLPPAQQKNDIFPRLAEKAERIVIQQFSVYKKNVDAEANKILERFKRNSIVYEDSLNDLYKANKGLQEKLSIEQIQLLNKLIDDSQQKIEKNIEEATESISELIDTQKTRFVEEYTEIKNSILHEIDKKVGVLEKLNDRLTQKLQEQTEKLHERLNDLLEEFIGKRPWHLVGVMLSSLIRFKKKKK